VNTYPEVKLAEIFWKYGEERFSRKIAHFIVKRREVNRIKTTTELAELARRAYPLKLIYKMQHHPATKVFQALRIEVNDELTALEEALKQSLETLKVGGRLAVISYHSLEDRIVKQFFRMMEKPPAQGQEAIYSVSGEPLIKNLTRKPITPTREEIEANPRSRSAKLRALIKLK
jgi:16S rRNA (cytosine1402-N4)-methyltransferase